MLQFEFYGCWVGRPYDDIYIVKNIDFDEQSITINFIENVKLIILQPLNIAFDKSSIKILNTSKFRYECYRANKNDYVEIEIENGELYIDTNIVNKYIFLKNLSIDKPALILYFID